MSLIKTFEKLLATGTDNAMLRFSLGNAYYQAGNLDAAMVHLKQAVAHDQAYSAAWKIYGKTLAEAGRTEEAMQAYASGIECAEKKGDVQAAKEMQVFLRRLQQPREKG